MFEAGRQIIDARTHRYSPTADGDALAYADALKLLQDSEKFREFFISLLIDSPFTAYRWETPPIASDTATRVFEFVILDSPELVCIPDMKTFEDHFANAGADGVVTFENLGKDAVLVVPAPIAAGSSYEHLGAFMRSAPRSQLHAFWRIVALTMQRNIAERPLWLSTAGGGVAWVHVRLDSRPKYYRHAPYKAAA